MSKIRNHIIWISFICFCINAEAQQFKNKAAIDIVAKAGFYSLPITPELSSYVKTDFGDLRILDEKGNAVPYIIKSSLPLIKPAEYKPLEILSNEWSDSGRNIVIIENNSSEKISDFLLKIKNASVSRTIDLSGSDDKLHWFSITENGLLEKKFITDDDSYMEDIEFPLSSYHYFRLTIYNGKNDPLNIISAGRYSGEVIKSATLVVANPFLKYAQKDSSDHISYITIFNPKLYHVGYISLYVKGPKFFKRNVDIVAKHESIGNFCISSDSVFNFYLPAFKDSAFEIRIENGDNPPLAITSVVTGQETKKAIAYLEANAHYILALNNDSISAPKYDLQDFKDSISPDVPELKISNVELITKKETVENKNIFNQAWIWPVMFFVLLLLTFFTLKLLKDVSKKS
jgi:hypothetical protein